MIAASAEGYAFPTNLDRDPPIGGLAPQTPAELLWKALREGWSQSAFDLELAEYSYRRQSEV